MTMAAHIRPQRPVCAPTPHAHRECEGCNRPCAPDDVIVTTTGRRYVCSTCYGATRAAWLRGAK